MDERADGPTRDEAEGFAAWGLFLRVHAQLVRRMDARLRAEIGIPLAWYDALFHVGRAPGGRLRLQDLEGAVFLSQSGVSRLAARLEGEGLLARSVADADRRGVEVTLTAQGSTVLRRARAAQIRQIRELFTSRLSDAQVQALREALTHLDQPLD